MKISTRIFLIDIVLPPLYPIEMPLAHSIQRQGKVLQRRGMV